MSGITGVDRLYKIADVLPETVDRVLSDELQRAFDEPLAAFRSDVDEAIGAKFPTGYINTFDSAWNILVKTDASGGGIRLKARGTAHGARGKIRDAAALNRGVLRHKTWGRLPWHSQAIPPKFWDDPAERFVGRMRSKLGEVVDSAARRIESDLTGK